MDNATDVLDLGCGPGYVTSALARELPSARIVALDRDHELSRLAKELVAPAGHVHVTTAAAAAIPFPNKRFGLVIARYLFQHLDHPEAVASEVHRVLEPGGRIVVIDIDAAVWGVADPPFAETRAAHPTDADAPGGRLIGRRLPRILRDAGFVDVSLDPFAYHSDELGVAAFEAVMTPQNYAAFAAAPDPFVMMIGFVVSGVVPGRA